MARLSQTGKRHESLLVIEFHINFDIDTSPQFFLYYMSFIHTLLYSVSKYNIRLFQNILKILVLFYGRGPSARIFIIFFSCLDWIYEGWGRRPQKYQYPHMLRILTITCMQWLVIVPWSSSWHGVSQVYFILY